MEPVVESTRAQQHPVPVTATMTSRYVNNAFTHPTFRTNNGCIMQFVTNQCNDAPGVIGAIRLPVSEPLDIGGYVTENMYSFKEIAKDMLLAHMKMCNHHGGIGEHLTVEDFSFGLSVASVTSAARILQPYNRPEGGIWMLQIPTLLEPVRVGLDEASPDSWQFVINAYIHLNEPSRRGTTVAKRLHEEMRQQQEDEDAAYEDTKRARALSTDRSRPRSRGGFRGSRGGIRGGRELRTRDTINERIRIAVEENVAKVKQNFPPTPQPTRPIAWPNSGVPQVPPARS